MKNNRRRQLVSLVLIFSSLGSVGSAQAAVSLRNFRQIIEYLVAATGVSPNDAEIQEYYKDSKSRLPKEGKSEEITSASILAYSALSSLFCKKMILADKKITDVTKRRAHAVVDFKKGPDALNDKTKRAVLDAYASLFWQRTLLDSEVGILLDTMKTAQTDATATDTVNVLLSACSAVAASFESMVF